MPKVFGRMRRVPWTRDLYGSVFVDTEVNEEIALFCFLILHVQFTLSYVMHFRSIFLGITIICIIATVVLIWFVHKNRRIKVFRIASPTFLIITLIGCIIMYSEVIITKIIIHVIYYICISNFGDIFFFTD